ncbi:phenylacetate--CoA ligase family protein [Flagellimonas pacifica]|uniref:Phenylacetate-CoA ligase n=1 Tax=Flagellimonas pacifica TaxID=1247520 RepID=A0A285MR21_9FLAO|nr:phenylacetate--CoA ligase family protein [Allomuricauda parva]SNY99624.1 phenylacetate-CoA ligase [Allomuricauda parva]
MLKVLEKTRKIVFWSIDALKGGGVRKHYKELRLIQNNPNSNKSREITKENLARLLKHAVKTVPHYFDISETNPSLDMFPIINKQKVRENFQQFSSQEYVDKHTHEVTTSGSTGKPFKILHDKSKRHRNTADTIFFAERAGFELGSRIYYLRLWDKQYKKNKYLSAIQNISMHSVDDLSDENIAELVAKLENDGSNKNLLAYTSALNTICNYLDKNKGKPLKCEINSAIAIAEAMGEEIKLKVRKYFGVELLSRYSNSENGILAQQRPQNETGSFEINWASYYVEILDLNEDKPANLGEPGRIVVTDLFNYSMPLIRYDTGDVGIVENDEIHKTHVFSKIEGRKMDMFTNTKGEFVSSHIIHHILQFKGIEQFQFVEEENNEYLIKLMVSPEYDRNDESKLRERYLGYFGKEAKIKVKYVQDIPLLPSGKRKLVINNAVKKQKQPVDKTAKESIDFVH